MKTVLILLSILITVEAKDLIYPNGKHETFILDSKKSRSIDNQNRIYYKHGVVSNKTAHKDTRKLYVSFGKTVDIKQFAKKYRLKFLKITNKKFYTALFLVKDKRDIIELCSQININEKIRYAKPHWKAPRGFY